MKTENVIKDSFGNRLKQLMEEAGETTYTLAAAIKLSPATISRYTTGDSKAKTPAIEALARHFNVSPVWLMGYDIDRKPPESLPKSFTQRIGGNIKYYREKIGYSLNDLSERTHLSYTHLASIEENESVASLDVLYNIAHALNISVSKIMDEHIESTNVEELSPETIMLAKLIKELSVNDKNLLESMLLRMIKKD